MSGKERLKEIEDRLKKLESDRAIIEKHWIDDVKETTTKPDFDVNSKEAEKVLLEVADRYTPLFFEIDNEYKELCNEYNSILNELKKQEKNRKNN